MEPIYIKINNQPFPFVIARIDEKGIWIRELRPYWVATCGYLDIDNIQNWFKVLRKAKDIKKAKDFEESAKKYTQSFRDNLIK